MRGFLERFHDESLEQQRPPREQQLSFIVPSIAPVQGLQQVLAGGVQRIAALYEQHGQRLSIATIDQDATIVESHKRAAFAHYQGGRGYQPMIALWAEADLIVADQFRDGNVAATGVNPVEQHAGALVGNLIALATGDVPERLSCVALADA